MKDQYFKIDNVEALNWLKTLIANTVTQRNHPTTQLVYEYIAAWDEALQHPMSLEQIISENPVPVEKKKTSSKPRAKKKEGGLSEEDKNNPLLCNSHPTYGGVRVPRKDCEGCWSVYKAFHPLEYAIKRRDFERSQRAAEGK